MNARALQRRALGIAQEPAFKEGIRALLAPMLGVGAWGLVTGVAMVKAGMSVPLAIFMSLTVYAGSAQLAILPLLMVGAPLWVVWFTAACVNLRFVILSSMWRTYFGHLRLAHRMTLGYFSGDIIFVAFMQRFPTAGEKARATAPFLGRGPGQLGVLAGGIDCRHFAGQRDPAGMGLGFAGVLALLGVLYAMLKDKATWVACAVASGAAIAHVCAAAEDEYFGGDCGCGDGGPADGSGRATRRALAAPACHSPARPEQGRKAPGTALARARPREGDLMNCRPRRYLAVGGQRGAGDRDAGYPLVFHDSRARSPHA